MMQLAKAFIPNTETKHSRHVAVRKKAGNPARQVQQGPSASLAQHRHD